MTKKRLFDKLKLAVKDKTLKYTKPRELVLETIYNSQTHLNAEQIHTRLQHTHKSANVGIATVYRNLIFLESANLISSILLDDNLKQYEINLDKHHDHLICVRCGKIVEFINPIIETQQENTATQHNFKLLDHTMYLYGICQFCLTENTQHNHE
jgi:Fur family ferric uptake transcriptional regulator